MLMSEDYFFEFMLKRARRGGRRVRIRAIGCLVEDYEDLMGWGVFVKYGSDSEAAVESKCGGGDDGVGGREQVVVVERKVEGRKRRVGYLCISLS